MLLSQWCSVSVVIDHLHTDDDLCICQLPAVLQPPERSDTLSVNLKAATWSGCVTRRFNFSSLSQGVYGKCGHVRRQGGGGVIPCWNAITSPSHVWWFKCWIRLRLKAAETHKNTQIKLWFHHDCCTLTICTPSVGKHENVFFWYRKCCELILMYKYLSDLKPESSRLKV